jgi:hypothetical protein
VKKGKATPKILVSRLQLSFDASAVPSHVHVAQRKIDLHSSS